MSKRELAYVYWSVRYANGLWYGCDSGESKAFRLRYSKRSQAEELAVGDDTVVKVTVYKRDPHADFNAGVEEVAEEIESRGYYGNPAKWIRELKRGEK